MKQPVGKSLNLSRFANAMRVKTLCVICLALALALILTICIFTVCLSNMQSAYSSSRAALGERVYSSLYAMYQTYQGAAIPGADIEGTILPAMKTSFADARTLNDAMAACYGQDYSVLTGNVVGNLNNAFDAYDKAHRMGKSTASAANSMAACMNSLASLLSTRFDSSNRVLPAK